MEGGVRPHHPSHEARIVKPGVTPFAGGLGGASSKPPKGRRPSALVALLLILATAAADDIPRSDRARQTLRDSLSTIGLAEADLDFKKDVMPDRNLSPLVRTLLGHPLKTLEFADGLEKELSAEPWLNAPAEPPRLAGDGCRVDDWKNTPDSLRPSLQILVDGLLASKHRLDAILDRVSEEDKRAALRAFAFENFHVDKDARSLEFWGRATGSVETMRDWIRRADDLTLEETEAIEPQLRCGHRFDTMELREETHRLLAVIHRFVDARSMGRRDARFGMARLKTPLGDVVIGDSGHQEYDGDAALIVDLGGDDTYRRAGSAMGTDGSPFSVAIDLGGHDTYHGAGSGVWGVGVLWDEDGNDHYETANASLGCGLFGAGALVDRHGDDHYKGDTLCEGAAAFGYGLLRDASGNDRYGAAMMSQGFAGVNGFGLLADMAGDDRYRAGGKYPDSDRYPDHHLSLSQGFSIGYRPFAPGGLGVLLDADGNDRYECEVYGQGCSYWYSCGVLLDGGGDDVYQAYQYSQGTGIHLSVGILKDQAGNDAYRTTRGLAQAGCHDLAVGLLWEGGGHDTYSAESSSQGSGINNAVGLLIEESGNDTYRITSTPPGQGSGGFTERRGIGSIGVLVDTAGKDSYSSGQTNDHVAERPEIGVAADAASPSQLATWSRAWALEKSETNNGRGESVFDREDFRFGQLVADKLTAPPKTDREIIEAGGDHGIGRLLLEATRSGDAKWKIKARDKAKKTLEAIPISRYGGLLPWIGRADTMGRVVMDGLLDKHAAEVLPLLRRDSGSDWFELRNLCVHWLGERGTAADVKFILPSLDDERTRPTALMAICKLGAGSHADDVRPFLRAKRGLERALAVRILGKVHGEDLRKFANMLDDPDWNVRTEAVKILRTSGGEGKQAIEECVHGMNPLGRYWAEKVGASWR